MSCFGCDKNEETQEVWVEIEITVNLPGKSINEYSQPQVEKGQKVWYKVTTNPYRSFCLRIVEPSVLKIEENKKLLLLFG